MYCQSCGRAEAFTKLGPVPVCAGCFALKDFSELREYLGTEREPVLSMACLLARKAKVYEL